MSCGMQGNDSPHRMLASLSCLTQRMPQRHCRALRRGSKADTGETRPELQEKRHGQSRGPSPAGILGDICGCFWAARKGQHCPPWAVLSQAAGNTDPSRAVAGAGSSTNSLATFCSALIACRASSTAGQLLRHAGASWARLKVGAWPCCPDLDRPRITPFSSMAQAPHI